VYCFILLVEGIQEQEGACFRIKFCLLYFRVYCRYNYSKTKFSMTQIQEAYKSYLINEGTGKSEVGEA